MKCEVGFLVVGKRDVVHLLPWKIWSLVGSHVSMHIAVVLGSEIEFGYA
jgi:hypothetical protein